MNVEKVDEKKLAAVSLAPRVTEEMVKDNIVAVNFFTAADGVNMTPAPTHPAHRLLTFCVIVLKNGFTVTGESACASPQNYNKEIGESIAYQQAFNKIYMLMGYELRSQLALAMHAVFDEKLSLKDEHFLDPLGLYVGTKAVKATPLTLGQYNHHRNWTMPPTENPDTLGYLVQYENGHVSWSPKEVFEASYRKVS